MDLEKTVEAMAMRIVEAKRNGTWSATTKEQTREEVMAEIIADTHGEKMMMTVAEASAFYDLYLSPEAQAEA